MSRHVYRFHLITLVLAAFAVGSHMPRGWAAETVDFNTQVAPIFAKYCVACHASDDDQGGLVMESYAALMQGGEGGAVITPGSPASSRLLLMASGKLEPVMPPDDAEGPNEEELATLAAWIEQGAIGPEGHAPEMRELRTPSIPTQAGLAQPITAIAATSQGKLVATATYGQIELRTSSGEVIRTIALKDAKVNSLEFSRDGATLLVGAGVSGAFGTAAIYSTETGELIRTMIGHRDSIFVARFSPDQTRVATGGYDRDILLWDAASGEPIREFKGHNGAINDVVFSSDGKVLISASSDETAKVWNVETGERLDTLSQSEGEVLAITVTPDDRFVIAGSADNRLRVWNLESREKPRINRLVATRFIDESPLVSIAVTPDAKSLVVLSEAGNIKLVRTSDWQQVATLEPLDDTPTDLCFTSQGDNATKQLTIALMNGRLETRTLAHIDEAVATAAQPIMPVYMDLGPLTAMEEAKLREVAKSAEAILDVARGSEIRGSIAAPGEADRYRFAARRGEVWAIDVDADGKKMLDPIVAILDNQDQPVLQTRLQAVRDSYFTFRGKDSSQSSDFRMFAWEEMHLNDYLYASGEVTRLWMHPRGPDSGFNVYPGEGTRWTYFGTTHVAHALGEPAYIVQPLAPGESPMANGLPVFDLYYENDDDPMRMAGKNSRLIFTAPADDHYTVRVTDTRGTGGAGFEYRLSIRPAQPSYTASVEEIKKPLRKGSGRESKLRISRMDGFEGEVVFEIDSLPPGLQSTFPVTIEAGQNEAVANVWAAADCQAWAEASKPTVTATAIIHGRRVERVVGSLGTLQLDEPSQAIPRIVAVNEAAAGSPEPWTLSVRRGATVSARVVVERLNGFKNEIGFGKELAGRNTTHGVYVDNIGLNGLLLLEGMSEREFFITADPISQPGKRYFFLKAEIDGGITTPPIWLEVLP